MHRCVQEHAEPRSVTEAKPFQSTSAVEVSLPCYLSSHLTILELMRSLETEMHGDWKGICSFELGMPHHLPKVQLLALKPDSILAVLPRQFPHAAMQVLSFKINLF